MKDDLVRIEVDISLSTSNKRIDCKDRFKRIHTLERVQLSGVETEIGFQNLEVRVEL